MRARWLLGGAAGILAAALQAASSPPPPTPSPTPTPPPYAATPERYTPYGRFSEPYARFFVVPQPYRGWGRNMPEPEKVETVRIGFLGPIEPTVSMATGGASHEEELGRMMLDGARLAVDEANARGGYRGTGVPFELVVHNDNGLWGASGTEIVNLAYRDRVWAILGTIDGANTHIAIRAALKIEIPIVNSGDTDPTLVETAIPWVFRVITDDRAMGYALADALFDNLGVRRPAALRANNRYGRIGIGELRDAATRRGHPFVAELNYAVGDEDFTPQLEHIRALGADAVLTWGDARESALILRQLRAMGSDVILAGPERMLSPRFLELAGEAASGVIAASPWDPTRNDPALERFRGAFRQRFGAEPDTQAAHAYDGMRMILAAVEAAGLNRALIRDALAEMKTFDGVTGTKHFDAAFTNRSDAYLALLRRGRWVFFRAGEPLHP